MKRILAFLLAFLMLFSSVPVEVLALSFTNKEEGLTFSNTENGLTFNQASPASDEGLQTAAEEEGLPVHFFVTTLTEAQKVRNGDYKRYKENLWGKKDGSSGIYAIPTVLEGETGKAINSANGIRAHMVENDIITYVAQWPEGGADTFRKFTETYTIGNTSYSGEKYEVQWVTICARNDGASWFGGESWKRCGCGANYDHIHIDGILTQKVELQPQTLNLQKQITKAQSTEQTFRFKLYRLGLDTQYKPTDQIVGDSVAEFVATIPAGETSAPIVLSSHANISTGYYKLVEEASIGWEQSGVAIDNDPGSALYIQFLDSNTGNNTVKYSKNANTGYKAANLATITNESQPTRSITVKKTWVDADNQDGIRPDSVKVHLLINGSHFGVTQTLSASNNWEATWTNVPDSSSYSYNVEEELPAGYSYTIAGNAANGFTLTNTHVPEKTTVYAHKQWDDDNNRDGRRPDSVMLQLYAGSSKVGNPVSVSAADNWQASWEDQPVKANGQVITYSVKEETVPQYYVNGSVEVNGQSVTYPSYTTDNGVFIVTNKKTLETTSLKVIKIWDDSNNQDNKRPTSITLNLFADGTPVPGANGQPITITVTPGAEKPVVFSSKPKTSAGTEVPLDGEVTVDGNQWSITVDGLLKHVSGGARREIPYSVTEAPVEDYTTSYAAATDAAGNPVINQWTITNTHTPANCEIQVTKSWVDGENQDGIRPASVTVSVKKGSTVVDTITLSAGTNWTGKSSPLPKYENGVDISGGYTVEETSYQMADGTTGNLVQNADGTATIPAPENHATGYTAVISGSPAAGYTITNTHTPAEIDITVTKHWEDMNNNDGIRPYAVVVDLRKNGEKIDSATLKGNDEDNALSESETWENMPRYQNGVAITYTVEEVAHYNYRSNYDAKTPDFVIPDGYSAYHFYSTKNPDYFKELGLEYGLDHLHALVVNKYTPAVTDLNIQKIWDDDNNRDGDRPESLKFHVWKTTTNPDKDTDGLVNVDPSKTNGWTEVTTVEMKPGTEDRWLDLTVSNLPKYDNQKPIYYSVTEEVPTGYEASYKLNLNRNIVTVTNTKKLDTTSITVTKQWNDNDNQDGMRPDGVIMTLYSGGTTMKDGNGNPITLTITENNGTVTGTLSGNGRTPTNKDVPLTVTSADSDADHWRVTIGGLLANAYDKEGVSSVYSVAETGYIKNGVTNNGVISGYVSSGIGNADNNYTITNTHSPATVDIPVLKRWDDKENQDGKRPTSVFVSLQTSTDYDETDGVTWTTPTDAKYRKELTLLGNWMGTFEDMPRYDNGTEIKYKVVEDEVEHYELQETNTVWNGTTVTLTNVHTPETTSVTATKLWNDNDNVDKKRPTSVTFHLLNDKGHMGEAYKAVLSETASGTTDVGDTGVKITYSKDGRGNWTVTWNNLPKYNGGDLIDYKVQEEALSDQYSASTKREGGIIYITNTRAQDTTNVSMYKIWDDDFNRDGKRPQSIQVSLKANGVVVDGKTATLNAANHWKHTWEKLPVNDADGKIKYEIVEVKPSDPGYDYADPVYSTDSETQSLVVKNSRVLDKTTLNIKKVWNDNNNQDNKRPTSITLNLLYNGIPVPDAEGDPITITVAPGTETPVILSSNTAKTATGVETTLSATLTGKFEDAEWGVEVSGLLKNLTGSVGDVIAYSVTEDSVGDYTTAYSTVTSDSGNTITITNTHVPEVLTIPVKKVWQDDENRDGIRPESVTVSIKRNGETLQSLELKASNNWSGTFAPLSKYENGVDISTEYTVEETKYRMAGQATSQSLVEDEESGEFVIPAQNNRFTGYTPTVTGSVTEGFTVTNTHEVDKIKVSVTNQWTDEGNNDGKRPHAVVIELRKNGVTINDVTLLGTDTLKPNHTWDKDSNGIDLYRYEAGVIVTYTVVETSHYTKEAPDTLVSNTPQEYSIDHFYSTQNPEKFNELNLTYSQDHIQALVVNSYAPEKIALNIQKAWNDDDNRDNARPGSLTFQVWKTTTYPDTDADGFVSVDPSTTNGWEKAFTVPVAPNPDNNGNEGSGEAGGQATEITATMTPGNEGRWLDVTVTGLPKYDNGQRVYYGVTEGAVDKYTPRYALNLNRDIVTVTNTKPLETTSITVTKQWEDSNDQDGMRPAGIILTLYSDGTKMKDADNNDVTLTIRKDGTAQISGTAKSPSGVTTGLSVEEITTSGNSWSLKIKGLLRNAEDKVGVPTVYSFVETGYIDEDGATKSGPIPGYTMVDGSGNPISTAVASNGAVTIINKHTPVTTEIPVVKTWSDNGDQDGKRPGSVSLHLETLTDDGWVAVENAEISLTAVGNWMGKFQNVTQYKDGGTPVQYRVVEAAVDDYNLVGGVAQPVIEKWNGGTVTINNVHTPETVDITAMKVWEDADNADKKRPETVIFHLLNDKGHMGTNYTATLSANGAPTVLDENTQVTREYGSWTVTWKNLPKYNGGQEIDYVVQESPLVEEVNGKQESLGYEASYSRDADGNIIVTNKRKQDTTDITVNKVWDDDFNRDGQRPTSVTVQLKADGNPLEGKTATLTADNHWKHTWTNLPKNKIKDQSSVAIEYTVEETPINSDLGYTVSYGGTHTGELIVTNSRELERTTLSVVKKWDDNNNQDGKRPGSITLNLLYNGIPVPGENGHPVTITVTPSDVTFSSAAKTPTGVEVALTGSVMVEGNEWHITVGNLLKHVTGAIREEIVYSVTEASVEHYTTSYPVNTTDSARLVTNTHAPVQLTIPVKKDWVDDNNRDGIRPESVTVSLKRGGSIVQSVELNVGNNWTNAFTGIPQYENGTDISDQYTVEETAYRMAGWTESQPLVKDEVTGIFVIPAQNGRFTGYTPTVTGSVEEGFTVTNTHQVDKIKVSVTNQWDDYNNNDGKRPYAVKVELRKNGEMIRSETLAGTSDTHQLSHAWEELYRYEAGVIITYTVVETSHYTKDAPTILVDKTPEGYSIDHFYSTQNPEKFTNVTPNHLQALIINQYTPARTSLNIQKKWVDDNDRDGKRPVSLTFQVWATKTKPKADEKGISTVVPGGSDWGQVTQVTMTRGADGQWWDVTVPDLPMYHEGGRIYYGVTEIGHTVLQKDNGTTVNKNGVPEGYDVSYELNTKNDVVTVTNTHTVKRIDVAVTKEWKDYDNQDNKRPDNVKVRLYANGIPTNEVQTLSGSNNWSYTWKDLYAYYMGAPVSYDVVEDSVEFYEASYSSITDDNGNVRITVTNAHTPETVTVQVSNVWSDDDNRDNVRPERVTVAIMGDGQVVDSFELHAGNYWTGVSKALPKYASGQVGQEILYTVQETGYQMANGTKGNLEQNVDGTATIPAQDNHPTGYTASVAEVSDNTFTVTNVHNPELVEIKANKVWEDDNNRDGKRPEEITLHLLADNAHMGESHKLVANAANGWSVTWTGEDLYKYNYGEPIQYTVMEELKTKQENTASENGGAAAKKIEDYLPAYKQDSNNPYLWTVTNTYHPETTEVTVTKIWDDDSNRDGIRPKEIKVRLLADGEPVKVKDANGNEADNTIILSEGNNWVNSWTNLPKNRDQGVPIVYTVQETTVSAGYKPEVVTDPHLGTNYFVLTNKHVPQTTGVSVTKIWNDEDNRDGLRPEGLLVQLYANNEPIPGTKALLDENNEWAYTWNSTTTTPLYIYQTQWNDAAQDFETTKIRYSVLEVGYMKNGQEYPGTPEGYEGSAAGEGTYSITLTNTHDSEKITLTLHNVWNDNNNNDGIRPSSIAVTLKQGERSQRNAVIVTPDSNWTHVWSDLYRYQGGVPIDYAIDAPAVEGYTTTYSKQTDDATGNITIVLTHTHADKEQELSVTKVWRDNNNLEGVRPGSVSAQLYKNGEAYGDKITLSADNKWSVPVKLPVYENGVEISWTVKELRIPRYYSVSYDQSTLTITNTIQSKEVPKTGDFNNLGTWILLFGGCCAGSVMALLLDKKKKNK